MTTTIVSCYFKINSKHSYSNYDKWMKNMLKNIETQMIIFCDKDSKNKIIKYREDNIENTHIITMDLEQFHTYKWWSLWNKHHQIDPEKSIHNPKLYMIWAEKISFIKKAIYLNPFNTDFFMWCDIGCFRNRKNKNDISLDKIKNFPNKEKVSILPKNKIIFTQTGNFHPECLKILPNKLTKLEFTNIPRSVGGTMFIGYKDILLKYHDIYYEMLETFFKFNRFAGKDQNIIANISIVYPEIIKLIHHSVISNSDPWFVFHWLFC